MKLVSQINKFLEHPFPLWETTLTYQLTQLNWRELEKIGFLNANDYSTERLWLRNSCLELGNKKEVCENVYIEMPSCQLQAFYDEHGLELLTENEIQADAALLKLKKAFSILRLIEPAYNCVTELVRSIHILRQPDSEIDLSYSHPQIPFSIFVSVCKDDSTILNLRVAESILHEAMHLKLTMIESIVPLVDTNITSLFYSPWRDEERPVKGVLHGLFVFRAIVDFYSELYRKKIIVELNHYLLNRISQIEVELDKIRNFSTSHGLTEDGANLSRNLLPLN